MKVSKPRFKTVRAAADDQLFDPAKLPDLAKWSSAGFISLTSVLTFLGVKDGLLTRILAEQPTAALWAFLLVGLGVVLSLFGLAVRTTSYLYLGWVVLAAMLLGGVTSLLLADLGQDAAITRPLLLLSLLAAAVMVVVAAVKKWSIAMAAGLLVVATIATAMGLYSAVKISVAAKGAPESLRVRAKLTGGADHQRLAITLAGSKQKDGVVLVTGTRAGDATSGGGHRTTAQDAGEVQLWRSYFSADGNDEVKESYTLPVATSQWSRISVLTCVGAGCRPKESTSYATGVTLSPPVVGGELALRPARKVLVGTVHARHLAATQFLRVRLEPRGGTNRTGAADVVRVDVVPDASGAVTWTTHLPVVPKVSWRITAAVCEATVPCRPSQSRIVATYRPR